MDQDLVKKEDNFVFPKVSLSYVIVFLFCFGFVQKRNLSEHYHSSITFTALKHTSTLGMCGCLFPGESTEQRQTEHNAEGLGAFETMMKLTVTR